MEDAVETNCRVIGKVGILTKKSFSLLNSKLLQQYFG